MKKRIITSSILIAFISSGNLYANNFELALDLARYDNIEKSVKNENSIINYIKQYILDSGDVVNISRKNVANFFSLETDSQIFKNYNNKLIEIKYNSFNKKIEIYNLLPKEEKYKKMYINSINRDNDLTFDKNVIFTLDAKYKNILNLELDIIRKNLQDFIVISKVAPKDTTKAWFKPDSEGSFYYYYYSDVKKDWLRLGKIGKGEILTFNSSDVNIDNLIIFDGQEISVIDSDNNIENKYFTGNSWKDLNNKAVDSTENIIVDSVEGEEPVGSLTSSTDVKFNVKVGYINNFLELGPEEFDKYGVGSTIIGKIIDPDTKSRLEFVFLKVSENIFRTTSYYNNKLILLVKDLTKVEDLPYTDCYVFPVVDKTTINSSFYQPSPYNGKLFSDFILLNNKYYYIFDSYTSFKNFNSERYDSTLKPFLKEVLIRNEDNSFYHYLINKNEDGKLYLITDITNIDNKNAEKIVFTYGDKSYFPVAYSNNFKYYSLKGGRQEYVTFVEKTSRDETNVVFHQFDYLEQFPDFVDKNLAETPKVSSGVLAYEEAKKYSTSRYNSLGRLYLKDVPNNQYIVVEKQEDGTLYIVNNYDEVLLKNAEEMIYVPKKYLNDWLFNKVVKYSEDKKALVDAYNRTYYEYVYLVKTDPVFYFKEFYDKNVFSSNGYIFTSDITLVNRDYKDTYCSGDWSLPTNLDLVKNENIENFPAQGYKMTASYSLSNGGRSGLGERHYWVSDIAENNLPLIKTYIEDKYDNSDRYNRYYYYSITCKNNLLWSEIQKTLEYTNNINKL